MNVNAREADDRKDKDFQKVKNNHLGEDFSSAETVIHFAERQLGHNTPEAPL